MRTKKVLDLIEKLEPVACKEGFELVDLEINGQQKSPVICVYLDKEGGISLDDIAAANFWVGAAIEKLDPFAGAYILEVSSPGIDRPLRTKEHFERFLDSKVVLKTKEFDRRSKWTGVLKGVKEDFVLLEVEKGLVSLPFDSIKVAHVVGTIDFNGRKDL